MVRKIQLFFLRKWWRLRDLYCRLNPPKVNGLKWSYCPLCKIESVRCGFCDATSCNGCLGGGCSVCKNQ